MVGWFGAHLDQDNLVDKLGVLAEKDVERVELLRYTLDVVESVDTQEDFLVPKFGPELVNAVPDVLLLEPLPK